MASMRDIKRRKNSVQSTQQITKAMKLVSTVKLQRARNRAEQSHTYFESMYTTVNSILSKASGINHPYLQSREGGKIAVVVISSNRGLAGGYNSNVIKLLTKGDLAKEDVVVYNIGKKSNEGLSRAGFQIAWDGSDIIEAPEYADAMALTSQLLKAFAEGEISEIYMASTFFKNTVVREARLTKLLPLDADSAESDAKESEGPQAIMNFEPEETEALELLIPKYISSQIYGGMIEAVASENAARMQAMDNATNNAEEIISDLSLMYNRARQGSITQELTEIIAGAEAIS